MAWGRQISEATAEDLPKVIFSRAGRSPGGVPHPGQVSSALPPSFSRRRSDSELVTRGTDISTVVCHSSARAVVSRCHCFPALLPKPRTLLPRAPCWWEAAGGMCIAHIQRQSLLPTPRSFLELKQEGAGLWI